MKGHWIAGVLLGLAIGVVSAAPPLPGAVFTTNSTGTIVNQNIYDTAGEVYLGGGPQGNSQDDNCDEAGLPDGDYYFQVTDPSGHTLLSTDAIGERAFHVTNGVIATYLGSTHATGTGKCGSLTVALAPFDPTPNNGEEYKVWVTPVSAYQVDASTGLPLEGTHHGFVNNASKTDNFKVAATSPPPPSKISGAKFYDADTDGVRDAGEPGIPNWQISIAGPEGFTGYGTTTDAAGNYMFLNLQPGTYGVCEVLPAGSPTWLPTTTTSHSGLTVPPDSTGNDFGNVCLGGGGGLTLGFWSNKNGQSLTTAQFLCALTAMNLRNGAGAAFDPVPASACPAPTATQVTAGKSALRSWLLSGSATNMAYMLSVQMTAMKLNVLSGGVSGSALLYAPGSTGANAAGFATVDAVIAEANASLGGYGYTLSGNGERAHQEALKNALDKGNNNLNFAQPTACAVPYSGTETCVVTGGTGESNGTDYF